MNDIAQQYADALTKKSAQQVAAEHLAGNTYTKPYVYGVQRGAKYDRITQQYGEGSGNGLSVHAFVERSTGKLIKAAGWKAPAKDKDGLAYRYDLSTPEGFLEALYNSGFSGGYLYADYQVQVPSREAYAAAGIEYPWAEQPNEIDFEADALGNTIAREGLDRCVCGSKYWENNICIDCSMHVTEARKAVKA